MELIFLFLFVILPAMLMVIGGVGYKSLTPRTKLEVDATIKRAAMVTRANLGSTKAKTKLVVEKAALDPYTGAADDERAKAEWTAKFSGQELVLLNKNAHTIVKSWSELYQSKESHPGYAVKEPEVRWHWECSCGETESRKTTDAAKMSAKRHVKLFGGRDDAGIKDHGWLRGV